MRQITLADLKARKRPVEVDTPPDRYQLPHTVCKKIFELIKVQNTTNVLELMCHTSALLPYIPAGVTYYGYDTETVDPNIRSTEIQTYKQASLTPLLEGEPDRSFGLCIVHADAPGGQLRLTEEMCIDRALIEGGVVTNADICMDVSIKALVDTGIAVVIYRGALPARYESYLLSKLQSLVYSYVADVGITLFIGYRIPKPINRLALTTVDTVDEVQAVAAHRTPTTTDKNKPLEITPWSIDLRKAEPFRAENLVVRCADRVRPTFCDVTSACTWVGSVLRENLYASWFRSIKKLSERYTVYNYIRNRTSGRPLWDLFMLTEDVELTEDAATTAMLTRKEVQLRKGLLSYPVNDDVTRGYWSLAAGTTIRQGDVTYEVLYSEADASGRKAPKITLVRKP